MAWTLRYAEAAHRDLRDLDHAVAQRILRKLDSIKDAPLRSMKRLRGSKDWRLRIGDWRVVCHVDATAEVVIVKRIGHRSVVYD